MENVILVPSQSVQHGRELLKALGRLADAGEIELRAGAVVERHLDGRWHFPEETAQPSYQGTITSGALGALIGLLAGPGGVLLGGTAGLLIGSSVEIDATEEAGTILHGLSRMVPPGATAMLADVYETRPEAVDTAVKATGAPALRMSRTEVERQLVAAEEQLDRAQRR